MSEEGSEQKVKEKEPEPDGKKFFISHCNSYTGKALLAELNNKGKCEEERAEHKFCGTLEKGTNEIYAELNPVTPEAVDQVVQMSRTRAFRDAILDSDVIVYDLQTNRYEEVDYVIKTLKTSKLEKEKTLVLLSSVMTWVNTPPIEKKEGQDDPEGEEKEDTDSGEDTPPEEGQEEPEADEGEEKKVIKYASFKETDSHLRVPHERFFKDKNLETLALSAPKTQPMLKVHILCCGIRYGLGEGVFYDHFKKAWMQAPAALPILGEGDNRIPTIHLNDLSRIVNRLITDNIKKEYIFAVDRTKKPRQRKIVEAISKAVGTGQTQNFQSSDISDSIFWKDFLSINLKMRTSDVFKDGTLPEDYDAEKTGIEPEAMEEKLKFPWHCQDGIIGNALKLNQEFNSVR